MTMKIVCLLSTLLVNKNLLLHTNFFTLCIYTTIRTNLRFQNTIMSLITKISNTSVNQTIKKYNCAPGYI